MRAGLPRHASDCRRKEGATTDCRHEGLAGDNQAHHRCPLKVKGVPTLRTKGTFPASLCLTEHGSRCLTESEVTIGSILVDPAAGEVPVVFDECLLLPREDKTRGCGGVLRRFINNREIVSDGVV